jgi:hypothetical protein
LLLPVLSMGLATRAASTARELAIEMVDAIAAASAAAALIALAVAPFAYGVWIGKQMPYDRGVLLMLTIQSIFAAYGTTITWQRVAANRAWGIAAGGLVFWGVSGAIALVAGPRLDTRVGAAALLTAELLVSGIGFTVITARALQAPLGSFGLRVAVAPLAASGVLLALTGVAHFWGDGVAAMAAIPMITLTTWIALQRARATVTLLRSSDPAGR